MPDRDQERSYEPASEHARRIAQVGASLQRGRGFVLRMREEPDEAGRLRLVPQELSSGTASVSLTATEMIRRVSPDATEEEAQEIATMAAEIVAAVERERAEKESAGE